MTPLAEQRWLSTSGSVSPFGDAAFPEIPFSIFNTTIGVWTLSGGRTTFINTAFARTSAAAITFAFDDDGGGPRYIELDRSEDWLDVATFQPTNDPRVVCGTRSDGGLSIVTLGEDGDWKPIRLSVTADSCLDAYRSDPASVLIVVSPLRLIRLSLPSMAVSETPLDFRDCRVGAVGLICLRDNGELWSEGKGVVATVPTDARLVGVAGDTVFLRTDGLTVIKPGPSEVVIESWGLQDLARPPSGSPIGVLPTENELGVFSLSADLTQVVQFSCPRGPAK